MSRLRAFIFGLLGLIAAFFGWQVIAADANLSWINPTTNVDGSPLTDHASTNIYYSSDGTPFVFLDSIPSATTSYLHGGILDGEHCYYVTALRLNGAESAPSNTACKTVDTLLPGAPSGLTVN